MQPEWARRGERAIPKLDVPRMKQIDPNVMDDLRPIVQTLIARPLIAGPGGVRGDDGAGMVVGHADRRVDAVRLDAVRGAPPTSRRFGLSPRWRHFWLGALGCLVVESGHTLLATHTVHHRDGSDAPDPEGYIEYLSWREMPVGAARYRYRLMWWGWRYGAHRRRIRAELAVHAALHLVSLTLLPVNPILWIYLTLIHIASFAFAVLQSKGPQANWGREMPTPLMFVNTKLLAFLFFEHHQHLEHHAYPKVPLTWLPRLRPALEDALRHEDVVNSISSSDPLRS